MKIYGFVFLSTLSVLSFCAEKTSLKKRQDDALRQVEKTTGGRKRKSKGVTYYRSKLWKTSLGHMNLGAKLVFDKEKGSYKPKSSFIGTRISGYDFSKLPLGTTDFAGMTCVNVSFYGSDFTHDIYRPFPMCGVDLRNTILEDAIMYPSQVACTLVNPGTRQQDVIMNDVMVNKIVQVARKRGIKLKEERIVTQPTKKQKKLLIKFVKTGDGKNENFQGLEMQIPLEKLIVQKSVEGYVNGEVVFGLPEKYWFEKHHNHTYDFENVDYLCNFENANLDNTNLAHMDFDSCNFTNASAKGANFSYCKFNENTNTKNFDLTNTTVTGMEAHGRQIYDMFLHKAEKIAFLKKYKQKFEKASDWSDYQEVPGMREELEDIAAKHGAVLFESE